MNHSPSRIIANSFFYTGALVIQRILSAIYFWYYSNHLPGGVLDLGRLQFVLSFVTLWFILGDLGLYSIFVRESSRTPQNIGRYLNTLLVLKVPLFALATSTIFGIAYLTHMEDTTLLVLAFAWIVLDNLTMLFYGVLRAKARLFYESAAVLVYQVIVIAIGVVSLTFFGDPVYLISALLIGTALNFLFVLFIVVFRFRIPLNFSYDKKIGRHFLTILPVFAISGILIKILNSADIVLLKQLSSDFRAVGLYSIPLKLITALSLTLPTALMGALYPAFSSLFKDSPLMLAQVFRRSLEYLLTISIPVSFGFLALGDEIIGALWRAEYGEGIMAAKVMLFSLPFLFVAFPTGNLLNASSRQKCTAISRACGVVALLMLDVALIPTLGVLGAAIGLVVTQVVITISDFYFLRDTLRLLVRPLTLQTFKVLMSACMMYAVIEIGLKGVKWYVTAFVGAVVYFGVLLCIKGIDVRFIKKFAPH